MKYADEQIRTIGELIGALSAHLNNYGGPVWFRGQASSDWHLEPKLMRTNPLPSETHLLNRFKQNASFLLGRTPSNEFEWLFLMQHYGITTRLLDWSESPLAALYFAVKDTKDMPGALWVLLPTVLNANSNFKPDFEYEVPSFEDVHLQNYLPATIAGERSSKLFPMAAIAPRNSPRMQAQLGVFTITHRENIHIEDVGAPGTPHDHIWKYVIPADAKQTLSTELRLLGYTKFHLFPELENLAENL